MGTVYAVINTVNNMRYVKIKKIWERVVGVNK